jgi:DNA-directed RNA polymerase I subunit RPA2
VCTDEPSTERLIEILKSFGMAPLQVGIFKLAAKSKQTPVSCEVILNGKLVGHVEESEVDDLCKRLRYLKAKSTATKSSTNQEEVNESDTNQLALGVPKYLEICYLPHPELGQSTYTLYPGLYLFTTPGRMMRPVRNLQSESVEYIGTMEQCYLHVCVNEEEFVEGVSQVFLILLFSYSFLFFILEMNWFLLKILK